MMMKRSDCLKPVVPCIKYECSRINNKLMKIKGRETRCNSICTLYIEWEEDCKRQKEIEKLEMMNDIWSEDKAGKYQRKAMNKLK
jgi:hypothetical protein